MTLSDIQNSIYRRTETDSTSFTNANMLLAINRAYERVNALIRRHIDNYRPTLWTSSDLTTGTAEPKFDSLYHDLIALWPSYEYASENVMANAGGFLNMINALEKDLVLFYGSRGYDVFTITIASPGVITKNKHGLRNEDRVSFITTGALPTGISVDTWYYVIYATEDTFKISATKGGTAINTSGSQSGTHYYYTDQQKRFIANKESNK